MALSLRRHPLILAVVIVIGWEMEQLAVLANGALATTVALESIYTLVLALVLTLAWLKGLWVHWLAPRRQAGVATIQMVPGHKG